MNFFQQLADNIMGNGPSDMAAGPAGALPLDKAAEHQAMSVYSQKLIEDKEKELMESIGQHFGRIKEVERELAMLQLQLQQTAGPRKHMMEALRSKIETQNEKVSSIRSRYIIAKKTFEALEAELKKEEAVKESLCAELNELVHQAATAQLTKLEELKRTLEAMTGRGVPVPSTAAAQQPTQPTAQQPSPATEATPSASQEDAANPFLQPQGSIASPVPPPDPVPNPFHDAAAASTSSSSNGHAVQQVAEGQPAVTPPSKKQPSRTASNAAHGTSPSSSADEPPSTALPQVDPEEERRKQAEAAAARSRHVSLKPKPAARARAEGQMQAPAITPQQAPPKRKDEQFMGFDT